MKRVYKYLLVFVGSLFMFPLVSNAECSYERQAELSRIASNVQFSYTYDVADYKAKFHVHITNLTKDIYLVDNYGRVFQNNGDATAEFTNHGNSIAFEIFSNDSSCKGQLITTKYITLPYYNMIHDSVECGEYPDFKYCDLWLNTSGVTGSEFETELGKYKQNSTSTIKNTNSDMKQTVSILNLLKEYYYILIAVIILIVAIILKHKWR